MASAVAGASFECSLTGTVHAGQFRPLYDRLIGLCEHAANAPMLEHELLFTPTMPTPIGPARNDDVQLRLRAKLTVLSKTVKQSSTTTTTTTAPPGPSDLLSAVTTSQQSTTAMSDSETSAQISQNVVDMSMSQTSINTGDLTSMTESQHLINDVNMESQNMEDGGAMGAADISAIMAPTAGTVGESESGEKFPIQAPQSGGFSKETRTVIRRQWQICQYGHPEPGKNMQVRSVILVKVDGDVLKFMPLLGYSFEQEFVRKGYNFVYNNICKISLYRMYKVEKLHDPASAVLWNHHQGQQPWMVEICSNFVTQETVTNMIDEINIVRTLIAGSVSFSH